MASLHRRTFRATTSVRVRVGGLEPAQADDSAKGAAPQSARGVPKSAFGLMDRIEPGIHWLSASLPKCSAPRAKLT